MEYNERNDDTMETTQNDSTSTSEAITNLSEESEDPGLTKPNKVVKEKRVKGKSPSSIRAFFAGMLGGLIPAVIVLILIMNNLIPTFENDTSGGAIADKSDTNKQNVVTTMATDDAEASTNLAEVSEAVVGVSNMKRQSIWTQSEETGTGSGIIYKKENGKAYVITNHHVVAGAEEVEVVLSNDERMKAKVLGSDDLSDLAVLEIDGSKIDRVATLGTTDGKQVGETVYAIGNPLGMEFANSLTKGIISGLNRSVSMDTDGDGAEDWVTEVIQTDAAINPGNSGGALVDSSGKVIGINSMKIAMTQVEGIGFAIPIDAALPIVEQLESNGKVERPFIGISMASINQVPMQYRHNIILPEEVEDGMVVASVEAGSPADKAGLQQFDVITKIDGHDTPSALELRKYMYTKTQVGDSVKLEIYRNGKKQIIELKLTQRND
ncbi:S1C family serine protease [Ornithinibacillus bavariensis]|uniref:S1C family serine protease n=1 Tax=Ornithinibacillus bavariensis TaxID=545502 RepID=UPI003D20A82B